MKQYIPKQHGCPYRTSDGKCVNKAMNPLKSKKKVSCIYSKPEKCPVYKQLLKQKRFNTELPMAYKGDFYNGCETK